MNRLICLPMLALTAAAAADTAPIERRDLSLTDAARIVAARVSIVGGQWETDGRMVDYDVPSLPGDNRFQRDVIARIRQRLAGGVTVHLAGCVRPQDPDNPVLMAIPGLDSAHCRHERFRMVGNVVDDVVACTASAQAGASRMVMQARYERESFTIDSRATLMLTLPGPPRRAHIHTVYRARRVGDCPGSQPPPR